jgi:hypothetical protein
LPKNAPDCAVYILTGIWPIELQIQYKALIFYNNICNLNDGSWAVLKGYKVYGRAGAGIFIRTDFFSVKIRARN